MRPTLSVVHHKAECPAVVQNRWDSHQEPYNPVFAFFCPVLGTHAIARQEAIHESTERQWALHEKDNASVWIKVIDGDDAGDGKAGMVLGAAVWYIYTGNPYAGLSDSVKEEQKGGGEENALTCTWWPAGPKRDLADQILHQMIQGRVEAMSKPHLCTFSLVLRCSSPSI